MSASRPLHLQAAAYRSKLEAIQKFEALVEAVPDMARPHPDLRSVFADELRFLADSLDPQAGMPGADPLRNWPAYSHPNTGGVPPGPTTLSKIVNFLRGRNNAPTSLADILDNVDANPVTVKTILYKRNRHRFRKVPVAGSAGAYWQLADPRVSEDDADDEDVVLEDNQVGPPHEGESD